MIITKERQDVFSSGIQQQNGFKIAANASMMSILSDKLYSNKVLAVVRELICNAWDSHVAVGKTTKVKVTPPTQFAPVFSVKDFGIGLNHEDIMNLYTTYGVSLKGQTNNQIGGFGLGSKSPFAYTSQFSVVSNWEGVKRTYTAYLDEEGMPQMTLLSEQDTDELTGIEVSLPVKPEDISSFTKELTGFLYFFGVDRVEVVGEDLDFQGFKENEILKTDLCLVTRSFRGLKVDLGGVVYPIEMDNLVFPSTSEQFKDSQLLQKAKYFQTTFVFKGEIGEFSLAPSREALSYDQKTKVNLVKLLIKGFKSVLTEYERELNEVESYYEAVQYHRKSKKIFSEVLTVIDCSSTLKWDVTNIEEQVENTALKKEEAGIVMSDCFIGNRGTHVSLRWKHRGFGTHLLVSHTVPLSFSPKEAFLCFTQGRGSRGIDEYTNELRRKGFTEFVYLKTARNFSGDVEKLYAHVLDCLGNPPASQVFTEEDLIDKKALDVKLKVKREQSKPLCYSFDKNLNKVAMSTNFPETIEEVTLETYYVPIYNGTPLAGTSSSSFLRDFVELELTTKVYGIPSYLIPVVAKHPNWVEVTEELVKKKVQPVFPAGIVSWWDLSATPFYNLFRVLNNWSNEELIKTMGWKSTLQQIEQLIVDKTGKTRELRRSVSERFLTPDPKALEDLLTSCRKLLNINKEQEDLLGLYLNQYSSEKNPDVFLNLYKKLGEK